MVTVIKFGKSLRSPFHYNENKVKAGVAEVIHSANYGKDTEQLTPKDRIARLERQAALNEKVQLRSAHITLNFHPGEAIGKEKLAAIVDAYMHRIGFGGQPYIVYQHKDAAHPHVHIVSTVIKNDGTRIPTHNIGKERSEPARQAVEKEFNLVQANKHHLRQPYQTQPVEGQQVQYGRTETRRAITIVLDAVLSKYQYTSLPELNAVLQTFNLMADNGGEKSRIRQRGGLVYRVLDEQGKKVGAPIKASDIYSKPTLKFLEKQFAKNAPLRQSGKTRLQQTIDALFEKEPIRSTEGLQAALQRQRIQLVIRRNEQGRVYGLTYIDHKTGAIFNGSDLGKEYSAGRITERIEQQDISQILRQQAAIGQNTSPPPATPAAIPSDKTLHPEKPQLPQPIRLGDLFPQPLDPIPEDNPILEEELRRKKKKKRKRLHL